MSVMNVFKTNTSVESPLDASSGTTSGPVISDFLTVQSFANFATMTGAITAAWHGMQTLWPKASTFWVPYGLAFVWAVISFLISYRDLTKDKRGWTKAGAIGQAIFIAFVNSFVLGGAVVGTNASVT